MGLAILYAFNQKSDLVCGQFYKWLISILFMEDEDNIDTITTGSHPNRNPQLIIRHFGYVVYIKYSEFEVLRSRMGRKLFSSWFYY